jgi:hypothetical protein
LNLDTCARSTPSLRASSQAQPAVEPDHRHPGEESPARESHGMFLHPKTARDQLPQGVGRCWTPARHETHKARGRLPGQRRHARRRRVDFAVAACSSTAQGRVHEATSGSPIVFCKWSVGEPGGARGTGPSIAEPERGHGHARARQDAREVGRSMSLTLPTWRTAA